MYCVVPALHCCLLCRSALSAEPRGDPLGRNAAAAAAANAKATKKNAKRRQRKQQQEQGQPPGSAAVAAAAAAAHNAGEYGSRIIVCVCSRACLGRPNNLPAMSHCATWF